MTASEPLAIVDVHYAGDVARAACVVARRWGDHEPLEVAHATLSPVAAYVPGRFFERELPPVLEVLRQVQTELATLIVDGYVVLDEQGTPGLGSRLWQHFGERYAVIGVAKTSYRRSTFALPVLRGGSRRPLFVTAVGVDPKQAAEHIARMHGEHRLPTMLGLADLHARGLAR